jgi:hypothetical protein
MRNSFTVYQVFNKYNQLKLFVQLLRIMSVQPKVGALSFGYAPEVAGHKKSVRPAGERSEQYLSKN